jgi:hypothetical protein
VLSLQHIEFRLSIVAFLGSPPPQKPQKFLAIRHSWKNGQTSLVDHMMGLRADFCSLTEPIEIVMLANLL